MTFIPSYIKLYETGKLQERVELLNKKLQECTLCARKCKVDRTKHEVGFCKAGDKLKISSAHPHFGEEPELVGKHGSGTIFFTYCNLGCIFCQNYDISHLGYGDETTKEELANTMMYLQHIGCHNINFVTPTHFVPQWVEALSIAIKKGLHLPIVYNCGGYENIETIKLLDGIVDIYMPDAKYSNQEPAYKYSRAKDYPNVIKDVLLEMHRQVGDLQINDDGIATRGLLVRHLVLPYNLAGTEAIMQFIANEISKDTYVNIMAQYRPMYRAYDYPMLSRMITSQEYREAINIAKNLGLSRGF
jgi:putative pyruvate formate lyase activating enzyme